MVLKKTAWILYYSNSGNTRELASLAEETLLDCGWEVETTSLMDFDPDGMKKPELVLLGTPIHFWAVPAMARQGIARLPDLSGAMTVDWASNEKFLRLAKKMVKRPGARIRFQGLGNKEIS